MHEFAVMLKGNLPELAFVERFIESWMKFDSACVPIFVIVSDSDCQHFTDTLSGRAHVIEESLVTRFMFAGHAGSVTSESVDDQAMMLAVGELHLARQYLWADSHAVMLRQFDLDDFFAAPGLPYVFLSEHAESRVDVESFDALWATRDAQLNDLRRILGLPPVPLRTCRIMGILSDDQLAGLRAFWGSQQLTYTTAMGVCPDAMAWYTFWLEREGYASAVEREPIFKEVRSESQLFNYFLKEESLSDLARGYVGAVLAPGVNELESVSYSRTQIIGQRANIVTLTKAVCTRWLRRAPRVQRLISGGR